MKGSSIGRAACWSSSSATMTALHDQIFASVFPPPSEVGIPTPSATPILGSSGFGEPFGSQHTNISEPGTETGAAEQIKWDRAWHTATTFLSLRDEPIHAEQDEETLKGRWVKPTGQEIQRALAYLLSDNSHGHQLRRESNTDDLLRWYFEDVVLEHYVKHVLPSLIQVILNRAKAGPCLMFLRFLDKVRFPMPCLRPASNCTLQNRSTCTRCRITLRRHYPTAEEQSSLASRQTYTASSCTRYLKIK